MSLLLAALTAITPTHLDAAAFDTLTDEGHVQLVTLRHPASGIETSVTNYGARVVSLLVPNGSEATDVVLGFDRIAPYMQVRQNFGACVGRYIGRIVGGRFTLDGTDYTLPTGPNGDTAHGGEPGFSRRVWQIVPTSLSDTTVAMRYVSPDGESGFPGRLDLTVTYTLETDGLRIDYAATTDRPTVINPSNHTFFCLGGDPTCDVTDQWLTLWGDSIAEYDAQKRVTGRLLAVEGTPFDFRAERPIGDSIDAPNAQLAVTGGYDHCYQLRPHAEGEMVAAASLYAPASGLRMDVVTTEPAMQIYTANGHRGDIVGKGGRAYPRRNAICFETMHFADSPNQPQWPSTALRPGQRYASITLFRFRSDRTALARRPFGWATCTSRTAPGAYDLSGCGPDHSLTTLRSDGGDMRGAIIQALRDHDVVILDGSHGDFVISQSIELNGLRGKTVYGINGARLCTGFAMTPQLHALLDSAQVRLLSTSGDGTRRELPNGARVGEEREWATRRLLMEHLGDMDERYKKAGIFKLSRCENLIFRNLTFVGPGAVDVSGDDLMTISAGSRHIWVDHCEFVDGMDGNLDINGHADFITISWTRFRYTARTYDHANTNLVGSSDREAPNGEDNLNVTFAFCHWAEGCNQRMPMARFGTIHVLNCLYTCAHNAMAINPRFHSEFLIEGNYFGPGVRNIFAQRDALSIVFRGNVYSERFAQPADLGSVRLPYPYDVAPAASLPDLVGGPKGAGATL